jgi:pilus assembly protein CpaB
MSSRLTMVLAVFFLLGAIVAGYWGVVVSRQPAPQPVAVQAPVEPVTPAPAPASSPPPEDPLRQPVVVLLHDVPPYVALKAEDLAIERLKVAPAGSFSSVEQVLGRSSWRTLNAGSWLNETSFASGGALAKMIRPQERALALNVDEVIGAGGQLSPGDYVDVLLYLPQDALNTQSSSQVAVPALRVLSVGELLGPTLDGNPARNSTAEERQNQEARKASARTVVVAVPQVLLSRLMLATQAGVLRLAVRSAEENNLEQYWASEGGQDQMVAVRLDSAQRDLLQFSRLSMGGAVRAPSGTQAPRGPRAVEVIRGAQISQQTP